MSIVLEDRVGQANSGRGAQFWSDDLWLMTAVAHAHRHESAQAITPSQAKATCTE
jgi:hypothetical protein